MTVAWDNAQKRTLQRAVAEVLCVLPMYHCSYSKPVGMLARLITAGAGHREGKGLPAMTVWLQKRAKNICLWTCRPLTRLRRPRMVRSRHISSTATHRMKRILGRRSIWRGPAVQISHHGNLSTCKRMLNLTALHCRCKGLMLFRIQYASYIYSMQQSFRAAHLEKIVNGNDTSPCHHGLFSLLA